MAGKLFENASSWAKVWGFWHGEYMVGGELGGGAGDGSLPSYADINLGSSRGSCGIREWVTMSSISHTLLIPHFLFTPPNTSLTLFCLHVPYLAHEKHIFISFLLLDPWSFFLGVKEATISYCGDSWMGSEIGGFQKEEGHGVAFLVWLVSYLIQ